MARSGYLPIASALRRLLLIAPGFGLFYVFGFSPASADMITFSDGTFADVDWDVTVFFTMGPGGVVDAQQVTSGGNPGAYRKITNTVYSAPPYAYVVGFHRFISAVYDPSGVSPLLSVDFTEDTCLLIGHGDGQGSGAAVRQGGLVFVSERYLIPQFYWQHHELNGLTAADFHLWNDPSAHPDFTGTGGPIEFGFFRCNGTYSAGYTIVAGCDNWSVTLHTEYTALVYPDGAGSYPTIQAAVDAVASGQTVLLTSGVFNGPGNRDIDFGGKAVTIRSQAGHPDSCIIDCEGTPSDPHRGFVFDSGEGPGAVLQAVTIRNGYAPGANPRGGAVLCVHASPTIMSCVFADNRAEAGGAVYCENLAWAVLQSCTFVGNTAECGGAVGCSFSAPRIANSTFCANSATASVAAGAGIECWNHAAPTIDNTIIAFSSNGQAVRCHEGATATLGCCDLYGNLGGDWVGALASQLGQDGNFSLDPCFCDQEARDLHLWNHSPCNQAGHCGLIGAWPVGCTEPQVALEPRVAQSTAPILLRATPNPFTTATTLDFSLPTPGEVRLEVADPAGRLVRALLGRKLSAGRHRCPWDGHDESGRMLPAGSYYYRLRVDGQVVATNAAVILR